MIKTSDVPAFITVSLKSAVQLCCDSNVCLLSVLIAATGSVHTPRKIDLKPWSEPVTQLVTLILVENVHLAWSSVT